MLLFGHLGITLGTATLAAGARQRFGGGRLHLNTLDQPKVTGISRWLASGNHVIASGFESLVRWVDVRFLLFGSLLPDIIDKPIGDGLLAGSLNNGRIFSHSLVFFLATLLVGVLFYRRTRSTAALGVSFGVMMHLVLDSMWRDPHTLLWPFLGVAFAKGEPGNFFVMILKSEGQSSSYIPEIVGFSIIAVFALWLIRKKAVVLFLKSGKVD